MDQLRGSAASSNLLSAPFTFFAGREDANREGLPTTRSSNLAGEREAN